jgi:hypothetical protein
MKPTTTSTSVTTIVSAARVNAERDGRRSKLRTPYSHGKNRLRNIENAQERLGTKNK